MENIDVKIKKLVPEAVVPEYAKEGDAGADVIAVSKKFTKNYIEYGVGFSMEFDPDYVCLLFPRSSITKKDLMLKNGVGVGDPGYRGEYTFRFYNLTEIQQNEYEIGDKIGQLVFLPKYKANFHVVDELEDSERGEGGYGSTGE